MDEFAQRWNAAGTGAEVPDGNYDVEVVDAAALRRRSDDAPLVKLMLQVRHGEQQGRTFDHWLKLFDSWLPEAKEVLGMYGIGAGQMESWAGFQSAVGALAGVTANVSLGHNRNGYAEVKVNTAQLPLTPQAAQPASQPAQPAPGDDDIPF